MIDLSHIRALSFDCYGTLIDWQTGILHAVRPALSGPRRAQPDAEIISTFASAEREAERPPYVPYKDVLRQVMVRLAGIGGHSPDPDTLWRSVPHWPAFPETPGALGRLQARFRLAIASNVDDDLFAGTLPKLGVMPETIVTAQQVRSYKPGRAHFDELLRRLKLRPEQVLHVGESRYHDVEPAGALGFPTVWVNRTGAAPSASGPGGGEPTRTVRTLSELADVLGC